MTCDARNRSTAGATGGINYLWDSNYSLPMLALERDNSATPAPLRWYSYGQGLARFRAEDGNNHYYLKDALGSVVGYTSGAGALERSYAYEPFGSVWLVGFELQSALQCSIGRR